MRSITVVYHREDSQWWAESSDVAGFTAVAEDLPSLRALVADGMPFYLNGEAHRIIEELDGAIMSGVSGLGKVTAWWTGKVAVAGVQVATMPARASITESRQPAYAP